MDCIEYAIQQQGKFLILILQLIELILGLGVDRFDVVFCSFDFEDEDEADECGSSDFCILFLEGRMDEFFQEGFGGVELMMIVFDFCHEERMKAVDGFEFEMKILCLLYGCFEISIDDNIKIFKFP